MLKWLLMLLLVLPLGQPGLGFVPPVCPSITTGSCDYMGEYAVLRPAANKRYFAVGALFDVHEMGVNTPCGSNLNPTGVLYTEAFLWAVDYWMRMSNIETNDVSVAAIVFDSCGRSEQMLANVLGFEQCYIRIPYFDRHNVVGFVGPTSNEATMEVVDLMGNMQLTLISPSADSQMLSSLNNNQYFLRTTPSVEIDVNIMTEVLRITGTKYVAAIYEQSEMSTFNLFKSKMMNMTICIAASYSMTGQESDAAIISYLQNTMANWASTKFVALFLSLEFATRFMDQVNKVDGVRNANFVYLTPASIPPNSAVFSGANAVAASNAIVLERQTPQNVQTAFETFKQYISGTQSPTPTPNGRIINPFKNQSAKAAVDVVSANIILATKIFLEGVKNGGRVACSDSDKYLCTSFFDNDVRGSTINRNIRDTGLFQGSNGDLRPANYIIYRFQSDGNLAQIGRYLNGTFSFSFQIQNEAVYQPGKCMDIPCRQCGEEPITTTTPVMASSSLGSNCQSEYDGNFSVVYYPPGQEITGAFMHSNREDSEFATRFEVGQRWIIALGVLAGLGILAVIIFEIYILYKLLGTTMGQKWRTMWLGQLLLFGVFLCYLTLFAYLPIPTRATCGITRFGVGVSYSFCFAVLLVKLMVILTSKNTESSLVPGDFESPNYLKGIYQFLMFVFVVGVQVVIDAQWLITLPPEAVKVKANNGEMVWICNHYTFKASGSMSSMMDMSRFVRNEFENHIMSLIYIMFLILITTLLALNAHGIITNHRESVFIGIASGFSIPIWLAWTLVGGLNRDLAYAHEFGDGCIAIGLFLTATLILFAMFLPKVRQLVNMGVEGIYFEDDRDTNYAGSVVLAPPSYKSRPNSVIMVNNKGIYSEPIVLNGDSCSTYSAPPNFMKRGGDSTIRGGSVLHVTDDLSGRRPLEKRRPMSEVAYGTINSRPRSARGTLPRSRSHSSLGAL